MRAHAVSERVPTDISDPARLGCYDPGGSGAAISEIEVEDADGPWRDGLLDDDREILDR